MESYAEYNESILNLFDGQLTLSDIKDMELPELNALIKAKIKAIESRNKAEEAARRADKAMKKGKF
jgi:hypothetical protein